MRLSRKWTEMFLWSAKETTPGNKAGQQPARETEPEPTRQVGRHTNASMPSRCWSQGGKNAASCQKNRTENPRGE